MHRLSIPALMAFVAVSAISQARSLAGEPTGSVQGIIMYGGYPAPKGKVSIHPIGAASRSAKLVEGTFKMDWIPTGSHRLSLDVEGIPKRYADPASSGLSIRVKEGRKTIFLDLPAEGIEVGKPAPYTMAYGPDGNIVIESHLRGKVVLFAFWSIESRGAATDAHFALLKQIRREFRQHEDFLIISLCADALEGEDGAAEAWDKFVMGQKTVDYGDGKRRFIDDSRWWQCMGIPGASALPAASRYGVIRTPELFLIGPDGRFAAVRIPPDALRGEIQKAIRSAR